MKGKATKFTKSQEYRIFKLHLKGRTLRTIANDMQCGVPAIQRVLWEKGFFREADINILMDTSFQPHDWEEMNEIEYSNCFIWHPIKYNYQLKVEKYGFENDERMTIPEAVKIHGLHPDNQAKK